MSRVGTLIGATLLASCTSAPVKPFTVDYRDEAGGVLLSVNSVGRWEQVADALQPNFTLANGDAALSKVLPATARLQQQILDAFGFSLSLGLPQSFRESVSTRTTNDTTTSTAAQGRTTTDTTSSEGTTSTATATTKPGVAPSLPSGTPAGGELPTGLSPGTDLGLNPQLQYRAANSLYQAIQLMNREVELAAKRQHYVPYIVRMQLVTIPYRRHLPYDIHAQANFFPSENLLPIHKADMEVRLPYVVPLIVTDDLEQAIKSRASEVARQLGFAVSLMAQGLGGNIGTNSQSRNRESALAADINSLLTVARLNDNGVYIRLGAANEATSGYSLVGRTYDIALLLLVPDDYFNVRESTTDTASTDSSSTPLKHDTKWDDIAGSRNALSTPPAKTPPPDRPAVTLSIITHTDFRDTSNGALLPERRDTALVAQLDDAFERTLRIGHEDMYKAWLRSDEEDKLNIGRRLIAPIQRSEYKSFYDVANSIMLDPASPKGATFVLTREEGTGIVRNGSHDRESEKDQYRLTRIGGGYLRSLWTYLASATVESSTKSASVELPALPDIVIPKQTALMRDDGKESLNIVLRDVSGITRGDVSAVLMLTNNDGKAYELPAEAFSFTPTTGTLALRFPSLAKWKLGKIDLERSHLYVAPRPCIFGRACAKDKIADHSLQVLLAEIPFEKPKPGFELRSSTNEIVVDKGVGTVKLVFDNFVDNSAELTWNGAEVKSAKDSNGNTVVIALDKVVLKSATVLNLEIQNAKPAGKVTFTATGTKGGKSTGERTKEFSVVTDK